MQYDGRRDYYRESHRSQQLPRGGGGGRDRDGYWDSGNSSSAYPQGPPMGGPLSGGASHHTSQPHSSTSSSSRTSTLDRNERSHGRGHADPERRGDREEVGGRRGKERDENWRPKGTVNDDLNSAVNRGRTLHGPLDDAAIDGGALTKKPLGPPAVDELILPPPASKSMGPQSKEIRGEDMRPYDRRRDDGGYREASDRRDRGDRERDRGDRYDRGMVKNQYATNLPPRLQRQAEMQYAQGGNRNQGRDRYGDEPRMMRQSDRSDDLYERAGGDQRRGSDRRTPEDAASSNMASRSQANARSEAGSWRISKREDQRRDSGHQIESKVAVPDATSDSVPAGKTSNDSNYVRNVASPATSESGRKSVPETVTTTAVSSASAAQQQSVLNKVSSKSDSPESTSSTQPLAGKEVQLASDRSEPQQQPSSEHHHVSTGEQQQRPKETTAPSRRSAEVERPSRPRSNANEPLGGRNVYEQSSSSSSIRRHQERGNSNRQPQQQQQAPVTVYTGGRDSHRNKQQPQLSHPQQQQPPMLSSHSEAGARSGDYRPDQQRAYSQQQHQQQSGRRDGGYRNAPPVLSQQLHSLEDNRVSPSLTAQSGQKNAQSDAMEPKKTAVDSNQQQRQTPPQAVSQQLTATGQSATANTASAQPAAVPQGQTTAGGGQAAVVLPYPGAPTSVRAVRTAYGPPASKAAFGSSDAVIDKPAQSATPPQGSIGGAPVQQQPLPTVDPKTSAPVLSSQMNQKPVAPVQPQQQQASHLLTRPSDAVSSAGRGTDSRRGRPDSRQPSGLQNQGRVSGEAGGRYGRERPDGRTDRRSGGERDRKLSTGSKTSATGAAASGTSHPLPAQSPNATVHSLNNNQQSLDVDDEWETASDNSHSDFGINHAEGASHATLDRNANITAGPNGGANRRTAASKAVAGSNSDLRSQKSIEQQQQQRTNYREDRTRVQLEQRGGKRGDRRGNDLMEQANYRGGPRGAAYGGPMEGQANYRGERRNDRGGGQPGTDLSRGRTNSYRSMNTPLTSGKGGPQNQQQQQLGPRNQDVLVNAMVKVTLDDPKAANALLDATTGKGGANIKGAPLRKNSSNIAPGGDYLVDDDMYSESEYIDGYGRRSNRQRGRTLSNASNKQQEPRRKEVSHHGPQV